MKVIPLFDRVFLEVIPEGTNDTKTASGKLYIPPVHYKKAPMGRAKVLACGPGALMMNGELRKMSVHEDDIVWYSKEFAEAIPYGDHKSGEVVMIREDYILAKLTELAEVSSLKGLDGKPLLMEPTGTVQ